MGTSDDWSFHDPPNLNNETQQFFVDMLNNFLNGTPMFIIDLFKQCVDFSKENRLYLSKFTQVLSS